MPDLVKDFEELTDKICSGISDLDSRALARLVELKWRLTDKINEISCHEPGRDIEWFTQRWPAQSRCFVIDYLPELQGIILKKYVRNDTIRLLDVGAAT